MIASQKTLVRLAERKLRRWGITPRLRGDSVFLCEETKVMLMLGDFWSIFDYDNEIKQADPEEPINSILWTRVSNIDKDSNPYDAWLRAERQPQIDAIEDQKEQIVDILKSSEKIQVQI